MEVTLLMYISFAKYQCYADIMYLIKFMEYSLLMYISFVKYQCYSDIMYLIKFIN